MGHAVGVLTRSMSILAMKSIVCSVGRGLMDPAQEVRTASTNTGTELTSAFTAGRNQQAHVQEAPTVSTKNKIIRSQQDAPHHRYYAVLVSGS
jgi:hypothetical protein